MSDAQPTDCEREVWNQVNAVLQESESILSGLQAYKGAGQEIRDVRLINSSALALWVNQLYLMAFLWSIFLMPD